MTLRAIAPGGVIGILGGGQLGRMLALAAARLGLQAHIYAPAGDNPAFDVAHAHTEAAYDDEAALCRFAEAVDVITYEFENVPLAAAALLAEHAPVRPGPLALEVAQDRLREKSFAAGLGIATPPFANIEHEDDLTPALDEVGLPAVLKTRLFGYDGKGQVMLRSGGKAELAAAWEKLGRAPCILEGFVAFECEISVLLARGADGAVVAFDVPRNEHEHHVLRHSHVPCGMGADVEAEARAIAGRLADALDYAGVLAVELFVLPDGGGDGHGAPRLVFNEFAPRVHNSGHWTEAACLHSQFDLHVRAVAGWPLPEPLRHHDCVMTNLLGNEADNWRALAAQPDVLLHLYGKRESRTGRKMGHYTRLLRPTGE